MELKSRFDWKPLPKLIKEHEADEKRNADTLKQAEEYWNAIAPYGAPVFDIGRGMELLLYDAQRFAKGLSRIVQKADEQKALMDHKAATGQEVTEADRQRWFAYLDIAHIAREVLSPNPPAENSGPPEQQ